MSELTNPLSLPDYLAITRFLLNTIREFDREAIAPSDARLWRWWLALVEASPELVPVMPAVRPDAVVIHAWRSTHHGLVLGGMRLAVPLDSPRAPGQVVWAVGRVERCRLDALARDVWAWFAARAVERHVPFVTGLPPSPLSADQTNARPVHCVRTAMAAEEAALARQSYRGATTCHAR